MHSPNERSLRRPPAVFLSLALHGAIFACVPLLWRSSENRLIPPVLPKSVTQIEVAGGSHAVQVPLPKMETAAHNLKPAPDAEASKRIILPVEQIHPPKRSGGGAPASPHAGDGSGEALAGNGTDAEDARPAFPIFSPHPYVTDRSLLPTTEQKIVVDVNVDALGEVVGENLVKGMGTKLDQIVLDIVKTWRFQPATVNGKPVPTEAELIFPFNSSYPISSS
jgi:TonB family protein